MTHRTTLTHLATTLIAALAIAASQAAEVTVYFSPNGGVAAATITEINAAKRTIRLAAYSISERGITDALIAAAERGVDVQLIVDPGQQNEAYSSAPRIHKAGINVTVDRSHQLMHSKYAVVDSQVTITGSANFTRSANSDNAENIIVIRDEQTAKRYSDDWAQHHAHAQPYTIRHHRSAAPKTALTIPPTTLTKEP